MEQKGIFVNYQMVEAINKISGYNLNIPEERLKAETDLKELKNNWLNDTLPGTTVRIGDKFTGMQDITVDDVAQLAIEARNAETYTVQNAGAMQYIFVNDGNGRWHFDFEKLDIIANFARDNQKKLIIDSAIVFGDAFPTKLESFDPITLMSIISDYTNQLVNRYGNYIERIDVLNAIFQRDMLEATFKNGLSTNVEQFWIERFGSNYAQVILNTVRGIVNSKNPNIKLGWNEFYLTNSRFSQRRIDFLKQIQSISELDVIGVQDRFLSSESTESLKSSMDEITGVCKNCNKEVCLTEFSCTASGVDLATKSVPEINESIQNNLQFMKEYASSNDTIKRIEGPVSDTFDINHQQLLKNGFDISTTGRRKIIEDKKKVSFDERSQTEIEIYEQIKAKNQVVKEQKAQLEQQKLVDKPKLKVLAPPTPPSNNGFVNIVILGLIIGIVCIALLMFAYMIIWR